MSLRKTHLAASLKPLLSLSLVAICLSACANRDPLMMIPAGLRATIQSEDRAAQPKRPVTVTQMLAKLRGEADAPAPSAPPAALSPADPSPAAVAEDAGAGLQPPKAPSAPPETLVRFSPASAKLTSVESLKLTLMANRLSDRPGPVRILVGPGQGALSPAQTMALVMQRGAAVKALLPKDLVARTELHYSPALVPDAVVLRAYPIDDVQ